MGLEQLKKEILDKAQREVAAVLKEAEKEAASILTSAKAKAAEHEREAEAKHRQFLEDIEKSYVAGARFEAKKLLLGEKKSFIEQVFSQAEDQLHSLPEKKQEALVGKLLAQAKKEIPVRYVYANPRDRKAVEKNGLQFREADMLGGIIAETEDGKVRVDYSFEELLRQIKEKKLQEIAQRIF